MSNNGMSRTISIPGPANVLGAAGARRSAPPRASTWAPALLRELPVSMWAYLDILAALVSARLAWGLLTPNAAPMSWAQHPLVQGVALAVGSVIGGMVVGLYERQTFRSRSRILVRALATAATGSGLAFGGLALTLLRQPDPRLVICIALIGFFLMTAPRLLAHEVICLTPARVLFIGCGPSVAKIVCQMGERWSNYYRAVGYLETRLDGRRSEPCPQTRLACLGGVEDILQVLAEHRIDEVVVDAELTSDVAVGKAVLECLHQRRRVLDQPTFHERLLGEVAVGDITTQWFLTTDVHPTTGYEAVKRAMDVTLGLLGLAFTLPLWPVIALAIRLESPGPVFYRQRRIGLHGAEFTILKFRTMRMDAECGGPRWAEADDPRITRVGRLLRRSRLDELPQLINILRGEMTLVGPRPERPEFVHRLADEISHYHQRHLIKPGLTGWAQIHCGYGASVADANRKLCFDLYYLKHRSIDFDVAILLRTMRRFVDGAR